MDFTAADGAAEQELIRGSELRVLETPRGHIGMFDMDPHYLQQVDAALGNYWPGRPSLSLLERGLHVSFRGLRPGGARQRAGQAPRLVHGLGGGKPRVDRTRA